MLIQAAREEALQYALPYAGQSAGSEVTARRAERALDQIPQPNQDVLRELLKPVSEIQGDLSHQIVHMGALFKVAPFNCQQEFAQFLVLTGGDQSGLQHFIKSRLSRGDRRQFRMACDRMVDKSPSNIVGNKRAWRRDL